MTFLPVVGRELRVAARRPGTYWIRCAVALGAIIVGVCVNLSNLREPPVQFAQNLFQILSMLAFFYCLISGVRLTADCLSEEKREGTLGLLFLTDLKGYDVVLGKLVATSLNGFYGLMTIFPVLAIPLLMGGVTNGEFWRMTLVLVNTFLFSLSMGIVISSLSRSPRKAMAGTFCLMLTFAAVLPACAAWITWVHRSHRLEDLMLLPCPFQTLGLVFDAAYVANLKHFWWSVGVIHGFTWLFLLLACAIVPRSWQDKPSGVKALRWTERWHRWNYGDAMERNAFRRRLLDVNAFFWLAGRARSKPAHVWLVLAMVACLWGWGCMEYGQGWFNEGVYLVTAIVLNFVLKFWFASEAGKRLGEDRKSGSLEWLLSTPLTVPDILSGQWLALKRQFAGPVITVIAVEVLMLLAPLGTANSNLEDAYVFTWVAGILMLVMDLVALGWLGMWTGLTSKNPNRATGMTVTKIMALPWLLWAGLLLFVSVASFSNSTISDWKFLLGSWFGFGIVIDLVFGLSARRKLLTEFRQVAMHRFTSSKSQLGGWFRRRDEPTPKLSKVATS